MNLKGKNVIVTGGSLGIGKETAKALVEKGANVLITGRSEDRLHKAKLYCNAETIEFDISLVSEDTPRPLSASSFVKVFQVILKNLRDPSSGATASLSLFRDFVMEANEETAHKKLHEMTTQKKQNGN